MSNEGRFHESVGGLAEKAPPNPGLVNWPLERGRMIVAGGSAVIGVGVEGGSSKICSFLWLIA